jgi:hypothetical protein
MRPLVLAAMLALVSCAGGDGLSEGAACSYVVHGACLIIPETATVRPTPPDVRAARGIEKGAAYWGVDVDSIVDGVIIRVERAASVRCGSTPDALGCAYWEPYERERMIVAVDEGDGCFDAVLPHEIGHFVIGDNAHTDPRWEFVPVTCVDPAGSDF